MNTLVMIKKWRNIIEMSAMQNNDERVFYSDIEYTQQDVKIKDGYFDDPRLVISRPVFDFEVAAGLDTSYSGPRADYWDAGQKEKVPDVTLFLDAYFIIKQQAEFWKSAFKDFSPSWFIAHHVGMSFYDCMSVGFPIYELMICRMLSKDDRVDKTQYVYPTGQEMQEKLGRDHYNLQDFLNETKDTEEKYEKEFGQLLGQFSLPMLEVHKKEGGLI